MTVEAVNDTPESIDLSQKDLPEGIIKSLNAGRNAEYTNNIVKLIKMIDPQLNKQCTISDIQIGFYRVFKKELKRGSLSTKLNTMAGEGLIKKLDKQGYYTSK